MPGPDRRRSERYPILAQVHVKGGPTRHVAVLVNLSLSGAALFLGKLARPGWL